MLALRLPWWSSDQDSTLPVHGTWVQSLVGELRSHIPLSMAKKKKKKKINENDKMLALSPVVGIFCEYSLPLDWITEAIK